MTLTYEDIHRLIKEPSSEVRGNIARKVADGYNKTLFNPKLNKIAIDIFRLLLNDTAAHVRKVIAEELKHNSNIPYDIIVALANDEDQVAEEILQHSEVLNDSDLLEYVEGNHSIRKLKAIAKRTTLKEPLCHALVVTGYQLVVVTLLENVHADISADTLHDVVDMYRQDQGILEALVCRGDLTGELAEEVYTLVSHYLKKQISKRHYLPRSFVKNITTDARESAILKFLSPWMCDEDLLTLVDRMHCSKRLTHSVIMRSLCMGEMTFFEAAIARRADIPLSNARKLLHRGGAHGFYTIYRASKLPQDYQEAIRIMVTLVKPEAKNGRHRLPDYPQRILQHIHDNSYDSSVKGMEGIILFLKSPITSQGVFVAG